MRRRLQEVALAVAELDIADKRGELRTVAQFETALAVTYARLSARLKSLPPVLAQAAIGVMTEAQGLERMTLIVNDLIEGIERAGGESEDLEQLWPRDPPELALVSAPG